MSYDLEATYEEQEAIKKSLRITSSVFNSEIEQLIIRGKSEIQSLVGPFSFSDNTLVANKGNALLTQYCFYHWNNIGQDFQRDNQRDLLSLQVLYVQNGGVGSA